MNALFGHVTRCLIAGFVALLPIGGFIFSVAYAEYLIAESWLARQNFYFPGLALVLVTVTLYLVGLFVSTFLGRWIWAKTDAALDRIPTLGQIYQTLKQVLGYGKGKDAVFQDGVLVPSREPNAVEIGLVTNRRTRDDGKTELTVFVPSAPNPAAGRLAFVEESTVEPVDTPVSEALKSLVSLGKTDLRATADE